jgi:hypothetical protein
VVVSAIVEKMRGKGSTPPPEAVQGEEK